MDKGEEGCPGPHGAGLAQGTGSRHYKSWACITNVTCRMSAWRLVSAPAPMISLTMGYVM